MDGFVKATLAPLLNELGVAAGRLVVDQVNYSLVESMRIHLPDIHLTDGDHLMQQVRSIKTDDEIAMQTLFYMGGEMAHVITPFVASGEHMSPPHRICTDKIIRNGDLCFIDIGAMWNGYFADIGRTTMVGKPSAMQKRVYTAVYRGLMAGVAQMRPGQTNQDVADAIIREVREHGFGDPRILSRVEHDDRLLD